MTDEKRVIATDMTSDDAKEILDLLETHEDVLVVRVRKFLYDDTYAENMGATECSHCEGELVEGQEIYMWASPVNADTLEKVRAAKVCTVRTACSEKCLNEAVDEWALELSVSEAVIGYYS